MSKDFWFGCIIKFIKITIPTLITIISFISLFFKGFEDALQTYGILGLILIGSFCFSLTLLLELTGMVNIIDDIGQQYIDKNDKADKSIYNFYNTYKKSLKGKKNNGTPFLVIENHKKDNNVKKQKKEVDDYSEDFKNYFIGVNNKSKNYKLEISYPDLIVDVIQEISNIAISSACSSISTLYEKIVNTKQPKSIICKDVADFKSL